MKDQASSLVEADLVEGAVDEWVGQELDPTSHSDQGRSFDLKRLELCLVFGFAVKHPDLVGLDGIHELLGKPD